MGKTSSAIFAAGHQDRLSSARVIASEAIQRPAGYIIPGFVARSVTVESDGLRETGFGEGPSEIAIEKAASEAYERLAFRRQFLDSSSPDTSSGWAAHNTKDLAIQSALFELIERDVALNSWESGGPFLEIPRSRWPSVIIEWEKSLTHPIEFDDLKLLLSHNKNGACISALLFNKNGGFISGHASAYDLENAILSAVNECFRAAHIALRFEYFRDVQVLHSDDHSLPPVEPAAHALAYAYGKPLPASVGFNPAMDAEVDSIWSSHQETFNALKVDEMEIIFFEVADRVVVRVRSDRFRPIFWGRCKDRDKRNLSPHFVG